MTKLAATIAGHLVAIASIIRFYMTLSASQQNQRFWEYGALIACLLFVSLIVWEIVSYRRNAPSRFRLTNRLGIRAYMKRWLESGGRTVIFSRDLSWVDEAPIRNTLRQKAMHGELIVCIENAINLTNELAAAGATIIPYGILGVVPRSRFTIVDFEKDGARVAIGGPLGQYHVIQEFRNGEHPLFAVAEDLARILIAYHRRANAAAG